MREHLIAWPRRAKQLLAVLLDIVLCLLATWLAFSLRLDGLHAPVGTQWYVYVLAPLLAIPVFIKFGLYRAIFRYAGLRTMATVAQAVVVYGLLLSAVLVWRHWPGVPRSTGVLQPMVFFLVVVLSRSSARFWLADLGRHGGDLEGRLLIYGAGIQAFKRRPRSPTRGSSCWWASSTTTKPRPAAASTACASMRAARPTR